MRDRIRSSLRWRIATWYSILFFSLIALLAILLFTQVRSIMLGAAQEHVDRIGIDIARVALRSDTLGAVGDTLPIEQELALSGNLDHWASDDTYVEIDTVGGYAVGKSSNLGTAGFTRSPPGNRAAILYSTQQLTFGQALVRDELVALSNGNRFVVKVGERLSIYDQALARIRGLLVIMLVGSLAATLVGSFLVASNAVRPIDELRRAMQDIGSEHLSRRLSWTHRTDELGKLAATFDAMLARLEEAFARERQFISDASHELKTPLTVIHANAQMLERWGDRDPAVRSQSLRAIVEESAALANMVNGMLTLSKAEAGDAIQFKPVALSAIVGDAVRSAQPRARAKELDLSADFDAAAANPVVLAEANLMRQLFTNIIDNAIKFTERGTVRVSLAVRDGRAFIDVADTGIGIDEASLGQIFDRFYRSDASHSRAVEGQGLGLAIVRSIARIHQGTVAAQRRPGGGSLFRVTLPTISGAPESSSGLHDAAPAQALH